ncbi:MAG: hypothetical protein ACFCVG_16000 [Kineosporiaceae bacterium]
MALPRHGAERWGVEDHEVRARYRCDEVLPDAPGRWLRAVTVRSGPGPLYAWLCQLRVAPYSYDWLDNFGRRSPRSRQAWCEDLAVGQAVMTIFTLVGFRHGEELTVRMREGRPRAVFGDVALSYVVTPVAEGSRLVAAMRVTDPPGPAAGARRRMLAWGDLLMMRKQLLTLRDLAEREERGARGAA